MSPVDDIARFSRVERWLHRTIAVLTTVLIITGAALYFPLLAELIGFRPVVRLVHLIAGLALPIPIVLAFASRAFRTDLRRLNRFTRADRAWLRRLGRPSELNRVGKFNAGQKLNSAATATWIIVMLATGSMMAFNRAFPDGVLTGATLVHDLTALCLVLLIGGHLVMAARDPISRSGMRTGVVPSSWAVSKHPAWAATQVQRSVPTDSDRRPSP